MFRKLVAGLSAVAIALGLVALTAGPASAHYLTIAAAASCNTSNGTYTITWTVTNSQSDPEDITVSSDHALVPVGTIISGHTATFTESVTAPVNKTLSLTGHWADGVTYAATGSISKNDFSRNCEPQHVPVEICHATPPDTAANGWVPITVDDDAIDNDGHASEHDADIIPAFHYWALVDHVWTYLYFPGKNLTTVWSGATGAQILAAGCDIPVTPTAPTFTPSVCTGPGTSSTPGYTIPTTAHVSYYVKVNSGSYGAAVAGGNYSASNGQTITVKAVADAGFVFPGGVTKQTWSQLFNSAGACLAQVTPDAPSFTDSVCTGALTESGGSFTVPAKTGVGYQYSFTSASGPWTTIAANTPVAASVASHVWIRAVAAPNYTLSGTTTWDHVFVSAGATAPCTITVVPIAPDFTEQICTGPGQFTGPSYTIHGVTGVIYSVSINGGSPVVVADGTYPVQAGDIVTVTARGNTAYGYVVTGAPVSYGPHTFAAAVDCLVNAPTAAPKFVDAVCTGPGTASDSTFEIVAADHVSYEYSTDNATWLLASTGVHVVSQGSHIYVRATADSGYVLTGDSTWDHLFSEAGKCLVEAPPATPLFVEAVCTGPGTSSDGTFEIVAADHVSYEYSYDNSTFSPATVGVHAVPDAAHVYIRAIAEAGYQLTGTTQWDHQFTSAGKCLTEAFPGDPLFTDGACTAPGESSLGTFEIVAADHVSYEYSTDNSTWLVAAVGVHSVADGTHIYIRATADPGYEIIVPNTWDHLFVDPGLCLVDAPVGTPDVTAQSCDVANGGTLVDGFITIPTTAHVSYFIDGSPAAAGNHPFAPGAYQVTAVAASGYTLTGYPEGGWLEEIVASDTCGQLTDHPIVTPIVTFVQATCSAPGSYTLSNDLGIADSVIWTVNGAPATAGTHTVAGSGAVTVHAAPNAPNYGFADGTTSDWSFTFAAPVVCDLTTLAITGTGNAAWLALSAMLLMLGGVLLATRRREEVRRPR